MNDRGALRGIIESWMHDFIVYYIFLYVFNINFKEVLILEGKMLNVNLATNVFPPFTHFIIWWADFFADAKFSIWQTQYKVTLKNIINARSH